MSSARHTRPHTAPLLDTPGNIRYGVFLRPSAEMLRDALSANEIVRGQYGFRSAAAYPPHVTLVGNFAIDGRERDLVGSLDAALAQTPALPMFSAGLQIHEGSAIGLNVDGDEHGTPNPALRDLVSAVYEAVGPLRVIPPTDRNAPSRRRESLTTFRGHVTLLGHDGADAPELVAEAAETLAALGLDHRGPWVGDRVHLLKFHSEDWSGRYWETMTWSILRSWRLVPAHP